MPNESHRLTDTTVKALKSMILMFNSLDDRITIEHHPKYHIVINNVSRFSDKEIDSIVENSSNGLINAGSNESCEKLISVVKS
jgi:hypothetical protein